MGQSFFKFHIFVLAIFLNSFFNLSFSDEFDTVLNNFTEVGISQESIGISITKVPTVVYSLERQNYGLNQDKLFNPASVMKLVTTMAAFDLFGKDYKFKTLFVTNGEIKRGVLEGDIFFIGGGDPKLVIEDIEEIVIELKKKGLTTINGNWIVDDFLFSEPDIDPSNFDGKPFKPYNVGPNAAMVNFKATEINIEKINSKKKVQVELRPELAGVKVTKKFIMVRGGCYRNKISTTFKKSTLRIYGKLGKNCKKFSFFASLMSHQKFGFSVFKKAWERDGGKFNGSVLRGKAPKENKLLLKWTSKSLIDLISDINKLSNNPMARTLFLNLSANSEEPASIKNSKIIIDNWFKSKEFDFSNMIIHNGAGLSRKVKMTTRDLTNLLVDALTHKDAYEWVNTLPIVGVEGTVSRRLVNRPVTGNAWLKTGSLKGVQAYGGYVKTIKNNWFAVSVFVNDRLAEKSKNAMDKVIEWIYLNK